MSTFVGFIHEPASTTSGGAVIVNEVILTLPDALASGTAINVQTGVYAGGGPATVEGSATLSLPAGFNTDAKIQVLDSGLELHKPGDVQRVSATQLTFSDKIKKNTVLKVRIYD